MLLRTRLWGAGKLLLLVGALAATFVAFALVGMRAAVRAREVSVPSLVGVPVDRAAETVSNAGLIVLQDPLAGVPTRRQRTIRVWVSSGPATTTVPALVGHTERTALMRLGEEGLQVASVSEFRAPDYPADAVVAQDPAPTARAPQVSLLLNRGEQAAAYVMPDLIGMSGDRAAEALRTRGFRVAIVGSQPYPGVPPGSVVRQQPAGGFRVGPSDLISLEVSR